MRSDIGPYSIVPRWLFDEGVSLGAIALHAALGIWANSEDGTAFPSRRTLSRTLHCSVDTVDRYIKELIAVGALDKVERYDETEGHRQRSNLYTVNLVRRGGRTDAAGGSRTGTAGGGRTDAAQNYPSSEPSHLEPSKTTAPDGADGFDADTWKFNLERLHRDGWTATGSGALTWKFLMRLTLKYGAPVVADALTDARYNESPPSMSAAAYFESICIRITDERASA